MVGGEEPGVEEAAELVDGQLDQALRRVVEAGAPVVAASCSTGARVVAQNGQ